MSKSNYVKLVKHFELEFQKSYETNKDEFTKSEILNFTLRDVKIDFRLFASILLFLFPILFVVFSFTIKNPFLISFPIYIITALVVYFKSFLRFTNLNRLSKLSERIKWIQNTKTVDYLDISEINKLLHSKTPDSTIKEVFATRVYNELLKKYQFNESKEIDETNAERLYLLYFFLSGNLYVKTTDLEFANIIGAILRMSPNSLLKEHLTELTQLINFSKRIEDYDEKTMKKLKMRLESNLHSLEKVKVQINSLLDRVI